MKKQIKLTILFLAAVLVSVCTVNAANLTVGPDGTYQNISSAYEAAVDSGDVILIADGEYSGPGNTNIIINKNLTIQGQSQNGTIINGNNTNWIFQIQPGIHVTIQNLTVTNGHAYYYGGAIYNQGTLTIDGSTFTNNTADNGGAILNEDTLTIEGSTFTNNTAGYYDGGSIYNQGTLTVNDSTFTNNTADYYGGAIYNQGTLTVNDSTFTNNTAVYYGGAIYNQDTLTIEGSTFTNNTADNGGAILNEDTLTIEGSTFTNNTADNGGAIYNYYSTCNVNFTRFYNNASDIGDAIYNVGGSVNAENNWWGTHNPNWDNLIGGFDAPVWWIYMNLTANTTCILAGASVNLTADFNYHTNKENNITSLTGGHIQDCEVVFASTDGSLNPLSKITTDGLASSIFTPTHLGPVTVNATLDDQTCQIIFKDVPSISIDSVRTFAGQTVNLVATIVDQNNKPITCGDGSIDVKENKIRGYKTVEINGF
jgi:predicted outer membrane repeat protein